MLSDKQLEYLEKVRHDLKQDPKNDRLTFDCYNNFLLGDRVFCRKGHKLSTQSKDGSMGELAVFKGTTSKVCRECPDFDTEVVNQ